ncbi:hypothetical protein H6S82_08615 [Planktothrix sp. FACHB-1355]|uniref:Uncharacterized protein n=1 Tax=Aerosakkonema funiforme FACHB-1375 TaxID=2949571 RepID=A0A926ZJ44_9CYAN|nr:MULTISPECIES: hypothetical protein [Oscillatoriales]MBD2184284.1 hypothetical protein [Aerosakkonema funiforme FACHB-1375]MBD3558920.1 hypothetical protein [Planktothrix sp. FACHB-1355]
MGIAHQNAYQLFDTGMVGIPHPTILYATKLILMRCRGQKPGFLEKPGFSNCGY